MRSEVRAVVIDGETGSDALSILIEVTLLEVLEGRPLFPNPMDEPIFYRRHFKAWIKNALVDKNQEDEAFQKALGNTKNFLMNTGEQ